jgi:hypothetical protein
MNERELYTIHTYRSVAPSSSIFPLAPMRWQLVDGHRRLSCVLLDRSSRLLRLNQGVALRERR